MTVQLTPAASFLATGDLDRFAFPPGWDYSVYTLHLRKFWFSRTLLPISEAVLIGRHSLQGRLRVRAGIVRPQLQIIFVDSFAARLQGRGVRDSVVMITPAGHEWDGVTDASSSTVAVNFVEHAAARVFANLDLDRFGRLSRQFGANRAMVLRPTLACLRLRDILMRLLARFDRRSGVVYGDPTISAERPRIEIDDDCLDPTTFSEDALIEMAQNVIDEAACDSLGVTGVSSPQRRGLALEVERILWRDPGEICFDEDVSLADIARRLGCSRRTIQLALQEQFGVGFRSLYRIIRLQQVRAIMREDATRSISEIASQFYISHFGRFASDYRRLFGVLPSEERRRLLRNDAHGELAQASAGGWVSPAR